MTGGAIAEHLMHRTSTGKVIKTGVSSDGRGCAHYRPTLTQLLLWEWHTSVKLIGSLWQSRSEAVG